MLEYDWIEMTTPDGAIRDSSVRFELAETGDRVTLTLTDRPLPVQAYSTVGAGWHALCDALASRVRDREPSDFFDVFNRVLDGYENVAAEGAAD